MSFDAYIEFEFVRKQTNKKRSSVFQRLFSHCFEYFILITKILFFLFKRQRIYFVQSLEKRHVLYDKHTPIMERNNHKYLAFIVRTYIFIAYELFEGAEIAFTGGSKLSCI